MAGINRFEDIQAWQAAREMTRVIYEITKQDRFNRDFGLRDQIRRAAVSVMSNIAEGFESRTDMQFIQFLGVAKGSAGEVRAQLFVAKDQEYISEVQFNEIYPLLERCSRQISKFITYLETNPRPKRVSEEFDDYEA